MEQKTIDDSFEKRASKYQPEVINVRGLGLVSRQAAKLLLRDFMDFCESEPDGGLISSYLETKK